jgi:hypothetical protein
VDPTHIAILTHGSDRHFDRTKYLIHPLARLWERMGLRTSVFRGTGTFAPAGLLIPHIDLTVRPPEYQGFLEKYPRVLNRGVRDISRSAFSQIRVQPDSPDTGPVIVKTNRNHGGLPERRLAAGPGRPSLRRELQDRWAAFRSARRWRIRWESIEWLDTSSYPVFDSLGKVPRGVFENPNLFVEQFVPEREGGRYGVRYSYVLGSREITLRLQSKDLVIKGSNAEAREEVVTPPEIGQLRRRLGLDYGKIDFVVRDGRTLPLDVNTTPAASMLDRHGFAQRVSSHLAGRIQELLEGPVFGPERSASE